MSDTKVLKTKALRTKAFWKSKTFWSALAWALIEVWNTLGVHFGLPPIPHVVFTIMNLLGFGGVLYGRKTATLPLGWKDK